MIPILIRENLKIIDDLLPEKVEVEAEAEATRVITEEKIMIPEAAVVETNTTNMTLKTRIPPTDHLIVTIKDMITNGQTLTDKKLAADLPTKKEILLKITEDSTIEVMIEEEDTIEMLNHTEETVKKEMVAIEGTDTE
jgi:hypothetical protein